MSVNPDDLNIEITLDSSPAQPAPDSLKKTKLKKRGLSAHNMSLGENNLMPVRAE